MAKSFNAEMATRFRKISADYGKINQYIHETAMLIINHANDHGDCSSAQGLVNCMPQSARKLALINWFSLYTPILVKDSESWNAKMHKPDSKLYRPFDIEGADQNPWYTVAERMGGEKIYSLSSLLEMLPRLAKQVHKKIEDDKVSEDDKASAEAFANWLEGLRVPDFKAVKKAVTNDDQTEMPVEDDHVPVEDKLFAVG